MTAIQYRSENPRNRCQARRESSTVAGAGETWSRGPACGDATVEPANGVSTPALRVSPRSDPQRGPSSALRHARRGLVTQHGADSRRVFSHESAEQDTRAGYTAAHARPTGFLRYGRPARTRQSRGRIVSSPGGSAMADFQCNRLASSIGSGPASTRTTKSWCSSFPRFSPALIAL